MCAYPITIHVYPSIRRQSPMTTKFDDRYFKYFTIEESIGASKIHLLRAMRQIRQSIHYMYCLRIIVLMHPSGRLILSRTNFIVLQIWSNISFFLHEQEILKPALG
uniref:Uncharacterized protein n=1 Tax=Parascaris univalens TaxID=6257 RepID=A0A915A4G6_PARUN